MKTKIIIRIEDNKKYNSIKECAIDNNCSTYKISRHCNGHVVIKPDFKFEIKENLEGEIWKKHPKYNFEISNMGRIKKGINITEGFCANEKNGHYMHTYVKELKSLRFMHNLVADTFIEIDESRIYVDHINGIKHDNRLVNVRRVSSSENAQFSHDFRKNKNNYL